MVIASHLERPGVDIHLEPEECELFVRLASDAEKVRQGDSDSVSPVADSTSSYFALSVALGRMIRALSDQQQR
jgi:hypothetical protein